MRNHRQVVEDDIKKSVLIGPAIATLLPALGVSITNVALPAIGITFGVPLNQVNWVVVTYLIAVIALIAGAGRLGDKFSRKQILLYGIAIFSVGALGCAISSSFALLIICRLIQGAGAALILSQTMAIASSHFPGRKTGPALGLLSTMAAIGTALGPITGGLLLEIAGWTALFWCLLFSGIISFCICIKWIPEDITSQHTDVTPFDVSGSGLLALICIFYALAINAVAESAWTASLLLSLCALVSLYAFTWNQKQKQHPLIALGLLRHKCRTVLLIANFITDAIAMSTLVVGPFYLTYGLHLTPVETGVIIFVGPLLAACSGYPAGKLVAKYGSIRLIYAGLLQMAAGTFSLAVLPLLTGVTGYVLALILLTPGRQMFLAANHSFILNTVAVQEKGLMSGLLVLSKNAGLLTGTVLMSSIFTFRLGGKDVGNISEEQLGAAFRDTFILTGLFLMLAFGAVYLVNKKNRLDGNNLNPDSQRRLDKDI